MSIGIATRGMFRYQFHQNWMDGIGGAGGGGVVERRKPQVVVGEVKNNDKYITRTKISVLEVKEYDNI